MTMRPPDPESSELTSPYCRIKLLDFRAKGNRMLSFCVENYNSRRKVGVRGVLAIEETNSVCVIDGFGDFGFMDLRWALGTVNTYKRNLCINNSEQYYPIPKLAFHKGQLFSSFNDSISVFCGGPDWVLT